MLHVGTLARWLARSQRAIDGHQVNEAAAGTQLRQPELGLLPLEGAAEHVAVELERRRQRAHPQHDVIDALHGKRLVWHLTVSLTGEPASACAGRRRPCVSIAAPRRGVPSMRQRLASLAILLAAATVAGAQEQDFSKVEIKTTQLGP